MNKKKPDLIVNAKGVKEILKRHKQNPKDKGLHKTIETKEVKRSDFNNLIGQSTKQEPFDKKKK